MSTLLSIQSISYDTPTRPLFHQLSFSIQRGERIGLIGHNGSGKSTLLRLITQQIPLTQGSMAYASHCVYAYIEQHLPDALLQVSMVEALLSKLPQEKRDSEAWRAEVLLAELGFTEAQFQQPVDQLSGGQHSRLLLGRALMTQPDLLFLDEPSNHLDLPTLLWLGQFLLNWRGSFVLVSHDQQLLDQVCNTTWILRDQSIHCFKLPCSKARMALQEQDAADEHRHGAEQKEIDRISQSAKRLAIWGKVYDNEAFAKKAKKMEKQLASLQSKQTVLTEGYQWQLGLTGKPIKADRVLALRQAQINTPVNEQPLFSTGEWQVKSGDRLAVMGANGCGKSSFLHSLWQAYQASHPPEGICFHPMIKVGYYDQQLKQLADEDTLIDALYVFAPLSEDERKQALIGAGFAYARHGQRVETLSGGERARLLFVGLSLGQYELLLLDEPTNHLDMEGKEALAEQIAQFSGAVLLVSHDQWLIEHSCQRFGLIQHQQWFECDTPQQVYAALLDGVQLNEPQTGLDSGRQQQANTPASTLDEEALLAEWVRLEALLAADRQRKPAHQKPALQAAWQQRLTEIQSLIDL